MGFFKAYDMRGTFGADFDLSTVEKVGRALPRVVAPGRWLVGRDCRLTSDAVSAALQRGLRDSGAEVVDIGRCTTPMVYFYTAETGVDGSVMVTASHNPPTDNGLKVSKRGALPVGYANGLDEVERLVAADSAPTGEGVAAAGDGSRKWIDGYVDWMRARAPGFSNLKIAVDCSNGMASLLVKELFPGAMIVNDVLDGSFPAHSPNPLKAEAREQAAALVREHSLDCAVIFDGDADRCMFLDERGGFVQPDYLIPVVARGAAAMAGESLEGATIIHDVRTSRGAIAAIEAAGAKALMVPVGHAFAKPALRESGAICGGELAGHYYFRDFHCCDSGVLAALTVLGEVARAKREGRTFSEMMAPVCSAYANSGELNFKVEDKDAAVARILAAAKSGFPEEISRSEIDGVRVEYADGWFNVRKSNTEPYLRLIVECRTAEMLASWTEKLKNEISDKNSTRRGIL
jgi:phosphomannomutase